ncbi:hypothetical protein [Rhodococcus qingshengii]|uniref:hypothetical protein n=1 Tax=Rhodococcus qingshengii TaxID=334542 RepID=UPI00287F830E|nr:hypothetical protein [Rhodococcus qingshengii]
MADAPETLDEMHKQIADIQDKIRRLRRERMDTENTTPNPEPLSVAIRQAHRDRDAVVNPKVEDLRSRAGELTDAIDEVWASCDHIRWSLYRFDRTGVIARMSSYGKDTLNSLQQSLEEEAVMRTQTLESLEAQGVSEFPVPKPFAMYPANRREF